MNETATGCHSEMRHIAYGRAGGHRMPIYAAAIRPRARALSNRQ